MNICTNDVISTLSSYVLAPSLTSFVLWVLQGAIHSKTKRLYFLARDGYLMYRIADIICRKQGLPIACRYLSCSRYSLRIPAFHLEVEEALEYICRNSIDVTLTKILKRAALSKEERKEVIETLRVSVSEKEVIPYARLSEIREALSKNVLFMQYMLAHSKEAFPSLQGYLLQEGLLEDTKSALVDSGWVGSMQKSLNQVLECLGRKQQLEGYYWGLYELPVGADRNSYHAYYFAPDIGLKEKVYFSNCLFESIFSAPHGMTLRYEKRGESYWACYGDVNEGKRVFIGQMEEYLSHYVELLVNIAVKGDENKTQKKQEKEQDRYKKMQGFNTAKEEYIWLTQIDFRANKETTCKLLKCFMGRPSKEEVEVYGNQLFADDVLEDNQQPIAAHLDEKELWANHVWNKMLVLFGVKKGHIKESAWYEGSVVRADKHVRYHLWQGVLYKYLLYIRKMYLWRKHG